MLLFLNYIVGKVDKMNLEFQSQYFRLSNLYSSISDEYRNILSTFVQDETIQSQELDAIDPHNVSVYKSISKISLGGRCEAMLLKEPLGENEQRFRRDCQAFLVELCEQMRRRFTFKKDSILAMLLFLNPKEALSPQRTLQSITNVAIHFPNVIKEEDLVELQDQWKDLPNARESLKGMSDAATSFWLELRTVKDGNNEPKFKLLSRFMCSLLALPHSSACVERVFSQLNMIKTKQANRMLVSTIANRLLAKQAVAREYVNCYEWEPSK